jgi:dihydrodipicolinate synthase/N-acetylneuraminate lyase
MNAPRPVKGIIPVLSTPFTPAGDIDESGLRRLVDWLTRSRT